MPSYIAYRRSVKVFIVDMNEEGAQSVADEWNGTTSDQRLAWAAQCDVNDWGSQRDAFEKAIDVLGGRIDYMLPIAGIGERRSFPSRPTATSFEKPDLKVIEVDEIGVILHLRSYGKVLAEENIHINAVCPNKIRTGISTAAVYDKAEKRGVLVPMEKLLEAFEKLLPSGEFAGMSGECLEVAPQLGVKRREFVKFVNEESRISAEMTYERSHHLHEVVQD